MLFQLRSIQRFRQVIALDGLVDSRVWHKVSVVKSAEICAIDWHRANWWSHATMSDETCSRRGVRSTTFYVAFCGTKGPTAASTLVSSVFRSHLLYAYFSNRQNSWKCCSFIERRTEFVWYAWVEFENDLLTMDTRIWERTSVTTKTTCYRTSDTVRTIWNSIGQVISFRALGRRVR